MALEEEFDIKIPDKIAEQYISYGWASSIHIRELLNFIYEQSSPQK